MVDSTKHKMFQFLAAYICPLGSRRGLNNMIQAEKAIEFTPHLCVENRCFSNVFGNKASEVGEAHFCTSKISASMTRMRFFCHQESFGDIPGLLGNSEATLISSKVICFPPIPMGSMAHGNKYFVSYTRLVPQFGTWSLPLEK